MSLNPLIRLPMNLNSRTKGKNELFARQFQRSAHPLLPKIEDNGNPFLVSIIRMANVFSFPFLHFFWLWAFYNLQFHVFMSFCVKDMFFFLQFFFTGYLIISCMDIKMTNFHLGAWFICLNSQILIIFEVY